MMLTINGYEWTLAPLQRELVQGELPQALLISGPPGVGKGTIARYLAQGLLCTAEGERPCGHCSACHRVEGRSHPDLLLVEPEEGRPLRIEQIREVERFLHLTPREGARKVVIIEAFHEATIGAANALLKTLEEPPSYAYLLLTADEAEHLLPTILSRVRSISLRPLPVALVEKALRQRGLPAEQAARLARLSAGRMGWAMRAAEDATLASEAETLTDDLFALMEATLPERFTLVERWSRRERLYELPTRLEYWRLLWRDVLMLQTDREALRTEKASRLLTLAQATSAETSLHLLRQLGEALDALRRNVNPRLLLENLALEFPPFPQSEPPLS